MKKILALFISLIVSLSPMLNGCKKESGGGKPKTYQEEFVDVQNLRIKGWVLINNSLPVVAPWQQGQVGNTKGSVYGFAAYSFKDEGDEYAFAGVSYGSNNGIPYEISSWMITPVFDIKNGDKISFYTRGLANFDFTDRLQVRLNAVDNTADVGQVPNSVSKFTFLVKDINETLTPNGYPQNWTNYELTISGFSATAKQSRIAFRYFPNDPKPGNIGIDLFTFTHF